MALYQREIKGNLRSFIIWTACIVAVMALFMAMYQSFAAQSDSVSQMLEGFSPELIKIFGFESIDFAQPMHYYGYAFQYLLLAGMIQFMILGASLISKEEDTGTINFLYAKPISRTSIVITKFMAGLTNAAMFFVVYTAATGVMISIVSAGGVDFGLLLLFSGALMLAQVMMLGIGMVLSMFIIKARTVMSASIGIVLTMYVLSMIINIKDELSFLKYLTPFQYFESQSVLFNNAIDWVYILLPLAVMGAGVAASLFIYNRKDLKC